MTRNPSPFPQMSPCLDDGWRRRERSGTEAEGRTKIKSSIQLFAFCSDFLESSSPRLGERPRRPHPLPPPTATCRPSITSRRSLTTGRRSDALWSLHAHALLHAHHVSFMAAVREERMKTEGVTEGNGDRNGSNNGGDSSEEEAGTEKILPFVIIVIKATEITKIIIRTTLVITVMNLQVTKSHFLVTLGSPSVRIRGANRKTRRSAALPRQQRYSGNGSVDNARVKNDLHSTQKNTKE